MPKHWLCVAGGRRKGRQDNDGTRACHHYERVLLAAADLEPVGLDAVSWIHLTDSEAR